METNLIKDIFAAKGIFAIFLQYYAAAFTQFFGMQGQADTETAQGLDAYIMHRWGERQTRIAPDKTETMIKTIIGLNLDGWKRLYSAFTAEYSAVNPISETRTKQGTLTRENTDTATNTAAAKAFNDTTFVDDTQITDSRSGETVDTYNLTETRRAANDTTAAVYAEINMRKKENFKLMIMENIIQNITLQIY